MIVQHTKKQINIEEFTRDGDFDAMKTRVAVEAGRDYAFRHNLGRAPQHVDLVWKDAFCDWRIAKDAQGQPRVDTEQIVMQFSAAATVILRFA